MSRNFTMRALLFTRANRAAAKYIKEVYPESGLSEVVRTVYVDAWISAYAAGRKERMKHAAKIFSDAANHIHQWQAIALRPSVHDPDLRATHVCACGAELCE